MTAIIIPGKEQKDHTQDLMMLAAEKAQSYMKRLFSGKVKVYCECGKEVKYQNNGIHCNECGQDMNVVGYVTQYGELYVRTWVDCIAKRFRLAIATNPENFEDIE